LASSFPYVNSFLHRSRKPSTRPLNHFTSTNRASEGMVLCSFWFAKPSLNGSSCRLPFDHVYGADSVTRSTIDANVFVDHVNFALFTDCIDRADFSTCSTIDTPFINPMCSHTHSPHVVKSRIYVIRVMACCNDYPDTTFEGKKLGVPQEIQSPSE
jgi:hypothetical protein